MKKVTFDYSLKNIPVPSKNSYLKSLIDKTQLFFQRIRWKVFWVTKEKDDSVDSKNTYGFKTEKSAPQHKELIRFENDVINLISNLEYRPDKSQFQRKLMKDVKNIDKSDKILLPADKTSNIYEVEKNVYKKLLRDNVTSAYEIAPPELESKINYEAKQIADKLELSDRIEVIANKEAYITLKDHKPNFENNPKCRLINPAKSNIGRISKIELQEINSEIREKTGLLQWRNTAATLDWFKRLNNKENLEFVQLDIVNFYPTISEKLFDTAIEYARNIVHIPRDTLDIIKNARKSLLFHDNKSWKKTANLFDVTMGAYDGAEICELVGLLILDLMRKHFPEISFGLYRDDGLGALKVTRKSKMEQKRKAIFKMFNKLGLEITIDTNLETVNFLDATLSIKDGKYWPYSKPNNNTVYVHTQSNHPPYVLKQIPTSINQRLCEISCDKEHFDRAKEPYEKALKDSGHNAKLKFQDINTPSTPKRNRQRKVIWYNPPFNAEVKTNFGQEFLRILDSNFPKQHFLHKFLNRKTVKIGYSCTRNMETIIAAHNRQMLNDEEDKERPCNCRNKAECPLNGKCCTQTVIYRAEMETGGETKNYIGCTAGEFKTRYNGHTDSFRNEGKQTSTTLSTLVWERGQNPKPDIKWSIIKKASKYKPGSRMCDLCISEKLYILKSVKDRNNLNKRSEAASLCVHRNTYKLGNLKIKK